jgi:DNA-binding response OmpR family regulator
MAGESVLIVDDAPVNLKLADILLRKEGFRVQTARDAAEALSALGAFQPDLMLVSAQLPGMDGLELTRCVKADPDTRHIVVVALTASSSPADRQQAEEAGCAGLIAKPLDTQRLGTQVRAYLESRPRTSTGCQAALLQADWLALTGPELETLRRRFLEEAARQAHGMLETAGSTIDSPEVPALLHRWAAVAGALGYSRIAEAARAGEEFLAQAAPDQAKWRELVSNLLLALSEPREAALDPLPDSVVKTLSGKRVALVGFEPEEADRLCAALNRVGSRPRLFEAYDSPDYVPVKDCSLVMVRVRSETMGSRWLAPDSPAPLGQPLLLVGGRTDILALSPAAQARAGEFLIDNWQAEEALMRCCFALLRAAAAAASPFAATSAPAAAPQSATPPRTRAGRPEVLIADDDPIVRSLLRGTLENYGMDCRMASSGPEALESIRQKCPDAAVLDINMPGMDGYLVLAAIREQGLRLPVLLLTARCHENDISRGFNLGADDYVVKPFNNVELIARIKRLLRR